MNDNSLSYNFEDTGALMTGSKRKSRTLRVILIVIASILVVTIALIGVKKIGDERYNDQIEIADKAFVEGDYVTAEAEYLKAVEMNKHKPKARESLAYTYAIQDKVQEAIEVYDELYEDTKEEKYQKASQDVAEGKLPTDPSIIPAQGIWRQIDVHQIPYYPSLHRFLLYFGTEYYFRDDGNEFNCTDIGDFPAMSIFMTGYGLYDVSAEDVTKFETGEEYDFDQRIGTWVEAPDPRDWSALQDLYDEYQIYDVDQTNKMLKLVFNITDDDIERMLVKGEEDKQLYKQDGKYYCVWGWPTGVREYALEITNAWTDGEKICVKYYKGDLDEYSDYDYYSIDRSLPYITRYALIELKPLNGKHYWSIYYDGAEKPEEIDNLGADEQIHSESNDNIFAELQGETFIFSSGAGGWDTTLVINSDGTFEGRYHDGDLGVTGEGYPNGTMYYCNFSGKFKNVEKIGEYEYRLELDKLEKEDEEGYEYIDNGMKYIASKAAGIEDGREFLLYTPGKPYSDIPEVYKQWISPNLEESSYNPILTFYGLYNIEGGACFF